MAKTIQEGRLIFTFTDEWDWVTKFDSETDYWNMSNALKGTKGVDIIAKSDARKEIYFIEIKDFTGYEYDAVVKERLKCDAENLSIEIAQKVRDTLACVVAAARNSTNKANEWLGLCENIIHRNINQAPKYQIMVIAWVEEPATTSKYGIKKWKTLQINRGDRLKKKLKWFTPHALYMNVIGNNMSNVGITVNKVS